MFIELASVLQIDAVELVGDKRSLLAFALTKKQRVRTSVMLGVFWAVSFALMVFLLPQLEEYAKKTYRSMTYRIGYGTIQPVFAYYFIEPYAYLPGSMFIYNYFGLFWLWCWENPAFYIFPGALLFCGFNRKSMSDQ